jgi:hypothetical protein
MHCPEISMVNSNYCSFLLRIWLSNDQGEKVWRALLENVETGEKHGFVSMEELSSYLKDITSQTDALSLKEVSIY